MSGRSLDSRSFLSHVPDEALPRMDATLDAALRVISPLLFGASVAFIAAQLGFGHSSIASLLPLAVGTLGYPMASLAHRRGWLSSEVLLFATAMWLTVFMSYEGVIGMEEHSGLLVYAGVIPLLFAAFIPWKPRYSLLLLLPALVAAALAEWVGTRLPVAPAIMIFVWLGAGVAAAVANQFQRRLLLALEQAKGQLIAAERMSSLGRLTASMGHELKTPIGASMNEAEMLRRLVGELTESVGHSAVTEEDLREIAVEMGASLATLCSALERAGRYLAAMREHTVAQRDRPTTNYSVLARVESVVTLLSPAARQANVAVSTDGVDPQLMMTGDPGKLDQILLNLVQNAMDALAPVGGGVIEVSARKVDAGDDVVIRVSDDGPGVPANIGDKVFEPLFTTRLDGGGTGLGLAICRDIASAELGGSLRLVSTEQGACFELTCPAAADTTHKARGVWQPPQELATV